MQEERNDFYVYIHRRATDNEVFYVGKGTGNRAIAKASRGEWWKRVEAKHGRIVEYIEKGITESEAFDLEIELIKFYRENGHPLVNITDGGEGFAGLARTDEHNAKIALAQTGKKHSDESKQKMQASADKTPVACSNGMMFESIKTAAEWLVKEGHSSNGEAGVHWCCSGKLETSGGFRWRYIKDGEIDESFHDCTIDTPIKPWRSKIICSNGLLFNSMSKCVEWLKENGFEDANRYAISRCCKGKIETAYGFVWKFSEPITKSKGIFYDS